MPCITVKILKGRSRDKLRAMMAGITDVMNSTLGYDAKHISVYIEEVEHDAFMEGGRTGADLIEQFNAVLKYKGN